MKESGGGATLIKVAPPGPDPPKVSPLQYRKTFICKNIILDRNIYILKQGFLQLGLVCP